MKPLVLVVEDEAALQQLLAYNLQRAGFAVEQAFDSDEALTLIAERPPDLVLLDWMLPWMSGLELCRQLRRKKETANLPIIMLTARTEEPDRLQGLDTGADDYITKPFSIEELIARVRAVLRRVRPAFAAEILRFADLSMDLVAHRVARGEREVHLSPTEFRLLRQLLQSPGRVFSRDQLLDLVWGQNQDVELRTVDATIRRLRRALNAGGEARHPAHRPRHRLRPRPRPRAPRQPAAPLDPPRPTSQSARDAEKVPDTFSHLDHAHALPGTGSAA